MRIRSILTLLGTLALAACGDDAAPKGGGPTATASPVPSWAKPAKEQLAEADRVKAPVAFENPIGMRFVLIPSGTFQMGSPADELGREEDETLHPVTLTRPYYLQTTEVTNRQYRRWKPDHDSGAEPDGSHSLNGDDQPVVQVSFDDAMAFVAWLNGKEAGRAYRLPTEAEWERACRAGTSTPFWWGNWISSEQANYFWNETPYDEGRKREQRNATVAVGSLPANPWGLFEMHGNASEWCSDWYDDRDYPPGPATDPQGPPPSGSHLRRGGAFNGELAHLLRAAFRIGVEGEGATRQYVGFRVAASVPARESRPNRPPGGDSAARSGEGM
jgi:formylglycine-generating enzyme required for sulfatase activity